jgi:uncharacterized protein (UPF0264 family)
MRVPPAPTRLLVSVRSAAEVEAALDGGADVIDVKEPGRGPLGQADASVLRDVLRSVAGRRLVSAALGELTPDARIPALPGLAYVKWGLAGWPPSAPWREVLRAKIDTSAQVAGPRVVVTAYADWQRAAAPPVEEVWRLAAERPGGVLLLDTFVKDPPVYRDWPLTLLDWLPLRRLIELCAQARAAGLRVALAGSVGPEHVPALLEAGPDWIAVRGAVCAGGRQGVVNAGKVRRLASLLARCES